MSAWQLETSADLDNRLASKCVKIYEILKINFRIFEIESHFGMAGLLIFENMVIWTEIEGYIGF